MSEKLVRPIKWPFWICCIIIIFVIVFVCWRCCFCSVTTLLLIRHADRASEMGDSPLSSDGLIRAQELVHVAGESGITALYATNTLRAQQTAAPLAEYLGLAVTEYGSTSIEDFIDQVVSDNRGKTVLIVGHADTVPIMIEELCGSEIDEIGLVGYDNFYVITVCCFRGNRLLHLKYGEPSS